jgi:hypothetical protein
MKPSTGNSTPRPIGLVFRNWVFIIPLTVASVGVTGFVLVCWLGDGTLASLYRVDYFMPLPLYCVVVFTWVFVPVTIIGFVVTAIIFTRRQFSK